MGMFGAQALKLPGYGPDFGQLNIPMSPEMMPQQPQAPQQPMPQPGMFGQPARGFNKPGGWAEKLGALGGVFLNAGGIRNDSLEQYHALQQQRQEEQRKQQLAEAARYAPQHIGNNIVRLSPQTEQYETLYKGSQEAPYRWRSNDGSLMELGLDGQPRVAYADPTEKPNYEWVTDPTTGAKSLYQIPPSSRTAPQSPPPGVTFTPLPSGGAAPKGPATFR
jgi:hypothetical protein